ncbi:glycosyltransferase [Pseudomonas protegens]|uniref:glycosyltransferase n=1 Tax=Pseudomonas protegens TaxID=380021 RepID=UPI000F626FAA
MSRRALQVCYYPIRNPIAGGQIRATQLANLIEGMGYKREFMGIYPHRVDGWVSDFPIGQVANDWVFSVPHDFEMRLTDAVIADIDFYNKILKQASAYDPDLLWLEHPFLWPIFKTWACSRHDRMKVVYSSHNVEWAMKEQLLKRHEVFDNYCVQRIYTTERDLLLSAHGVLCCSEDDQKTYAYHGRKDALVIPNGSSCPEISEENLGEPSLMGGLDISEGKVVLVFISSYHEPNWFGLRDLVLSHMVSGGLLENSLLILMGDICRLYEDWCASTGHRISGVHCVGRVTDEEKSSYFKIADIAVLPITDGGGTNLKTAEALLSCRAVAATSIAFRGFERHMTLPGVFCSPVEGFASALFEAMSFVKEMGTRSKMELACAARHDQVEDCRWPEIIRNGKKFSEILDKQ